MSTFKVTIQNGFDGAFAMLKDLETLSIKEESNPVPLDIPIENMGDSAVCTLDYPDNRFLEISVKNDRGNEVDLDSDYLIKFAHDTGYGNAIIKEDKKWRIEILPQSQERVLEAEPQVNIIVGDYGAGGGYY